MEGEDAAAPALSGEGQHRGAGGPGGWGAGGDLLGSVRGPVLSTTA